MDFIGYACYYQATHSLTERFDMPACTFFGHGDCPEAARDKIKDAVVSLIEQGVYDFYVGSHVNFDRLTRSVLKELSAEYPKLRYAVVLAYLDKTAAMLSEQNYCTLFPEGIENVPPRFAISWRNKWMINRADYVICYVKYSWGGAAQFRELAIKKGKNVIDLV